ncbi:hypothetical protein QZH41_016425 [Actinostola sp. cb2023]|nr:hypothetical protein QZH41_016425 [Actinostola sp. cb2023]
MPETDNPRTFVRPKPLPIPTHRGLKITARNSRIYTCEVPTRTQVAQDNYARRKHQMTKCGYRSVNYRPYQSVGDVVLNDRKLILSALGQDTDQITEVRFQESDSSSSDSDLEDEDTQEKTALTRRTVALERELLTESILMLRRNNNNRLFHKQLPTNQNKSTIFEYKSIKEGQHEIFYAYFCRKMINAVKLGFGLYRVVKEEQERKQAVVEEERRKKEEAAKNEMKPPSSDGENSDNDAIDDDLKSMIIPLPPSPTPNAHQSFEGQFLDVRESSDRPNSSSSTASSQRWRKLSSTITAGHTLGVPSPTVHVTDTSHDTSHENNRSNRSSTDAYFTTDRRNVASAPSGQRSYLGPPKSAVSCSSRTSRRTRRHRSARPYSPIYSNINYNDSTDRISVYRQLCALLWILEAMSQDQQPAVMPPITSCWNLKLLNEDPRFIRKRAEKDKVTEKDWTLFKQDPNRFTQRATSRRGTRRISIHPNFLQRLSNTVSTGSNPPRPSCPTLKVPQGDTPRSNRDNNTSMAAVALDIPSQRIPEDTVLNQIRTYYCYHHEEGSTVSFNEPAVRAVSVHPETQSPTSPANGSPVEKKTRLARQKSFTVTTVYNNNASLRAMQKLRAKNRVTKAFKNALSQKELDKLSVAQDDQQSRTESRVSAWVQATGKYTYIESRLLTVTCLNVIRFHAAAIAAFGTITLDHHVDKVPVEMKSKFKEIADEKALVLHDHLEVRDRNRLQILERKLMCLEMFNNMYMALDNMRLKSVVLDDETNEEMRQRVSEECKWYKDLIENLPDEVKDDLCCTLVLNKLASYGSLEGRKISSSQFVKVLSVLRVWEVCSPHISAAIEFVRDKVVEMSEDDYEEWFQVTFPQPKRAVSAPPTRTNAFRY